MKRNMAASRLSLALSLPLAGEQTDAATTPPLARAHIQRSKLKNNRSLFLLLR